MIKIILLTGATLLIFIGGFLLPGIISNTVHDDHIYFARQTQEPIGFLYQGAIYSNKEIENTCRPWTPKQILVQLQTWMFIPGPLVQICTSENDYLEVGGAGVIRR